MKHDLSCRLCLHARVSVALIMSISTFEVIQSSVRSIFHCTRTITKTILLPNCTMTYCYHSNRSVGILAYF